MEHKNTKYEHISNVFKETCAEVVKTPDNWKDFLKTASRMYKYSFDDQILIHAQRPDATACASLEIWNKKMFCKVNRGAKGIALIDNSGTWPRLKYIFDVDDVSKIKDKGKSPDIWELKKEHTDTVIQSLESIYGTTDNKANIEKRLLEITEKAVINKFKNIKKMNLSSINDNEFQRLLQESVIFTVLSRCGLVDYYNQVTDIKNFDNIDKFDTREKISTLGEAIAQASEEILVNIRKAIHLHRWQEQNKNKQKNEQKFTEGIVKDVKQEYNALKRESEIDTLQKGDGKYEYNIRTAGGLPDSKSGYGRGNTGAVDKIWNYEERLSEAKSQGILHTADYGRRNVETLPGNPEPGEREGRLSDGTDGKSPRGERGTEGERSDEVGSDDGKYKTFSGGNSLYRADLYVDSESKSGADAPLFNFKIETKENNENHFSPKLKFRQNIEAITLLKTLEKEKRNANKEEQGILAQYVGWGGLSDAFDNTKTNWENEYRQLKELLTKEEYDSARESTLNAHYTNHEIIQSIYNVIERMGFSKGNILEPAMGTGNFFGLLPDSMNESRLYGTELDGLTGRIAKQLYPNADIKITGFEKTDYPDNFFDIAVGNVPFGQYKVADKAYEKYNFLIHDYFFAKTLDKVRPGGVVAFITSKGTMDKQNPEVRKYLAQRAEFLGAVRLPNTAFKNNAGTEVTSDIIFLKKRDRVIDIEPDWTYLGLDDNSIAMNRYFINHPEMILGDMVTVSGPFGPETVCKPNKETALSEQLKKALSNIKGVIEVPNPDLSDTGDREKVIPADPDVKNYSYTVVGEEVYYRENSLMKQAEVSDTIKQRMIGMIQIRNCTRQLIEYQLNEYSEEEIKTKQKELNSLYDDFVSKHGYINSQSNKRAFDQDASYCLLCSLEKTDEEGKVTGKADMFSRRTIRKAELVTSVDTATEALAVSLAEKAEVNLEFMGSLCGKEKEDIVKELSGVIFLNPENERWENSDEYLSGNVREKLRIATRFASDNPEYEVNVRALKEVQPKELDASEIDVRIGATWIDTKYIEQFMKDVFQTPEYLFMRDTVAVQYSDITGQWNIKGKNSDYGNALINMTYGTGRTNAYRILEDSLNLRDIRIFDIVVEEGKEKRVLNKKETMLASQKQEAIREAFRDWIFKDLNRRQELCDKYNKLFNSVRPREYNGEHLIFPGMSPDITLRKHQLNAVAHQLYGDNTLLAHCVGAGKTFEMIASAMESKRLGLCKKSLFVVPNHLTQQWASDFLRLYPGANILAATKKDFEPANRKKFCSRIATGDYDAVIIGHSQFERIPLSEERQISMIEKQINEIELAIEATKAAKGERYTIKQMEKTKKGLGVKLAKLNDRTRKDDVVTFEELGVDRLFVDESHNYKNLFLYTKMRNVAGIAQTEAQKSSDMFAKCQYMDELTGGKGITFATGTPISNSMTELYTNMRYLQNNTLKKLGLGNFDSWAATFGETQTAIELAPEGTGYRAKTRFARFFNLPELISLFKECADVQTPDMLKLPVPEAVYENVVLKPSEYQKKIVESLAERAEAVRDRRVEPHVDNMLKITNDGRKLALDQRLVNDMLPDDENSKAAICVEKAFEIWKDTKEQKSTQLIFCDLSTPRGDGTFNVYEDIRNKLIQKGVPEEEIAFIHDANTELRKTELFAKVKSGQVRFLLGSTAKMGAGTNVQDKLIALHHLDVPWRPSDIEQQEGRILRQGNVNSKVKIFRYVTEGTFDSYMWQLIENKQKFIGQIMTSKSPVRSCEDIDEAALSYAEVKALATGNPYIKEKMDLDIQVSKLKLLKANHTSQQYRLEDNITQHYPKQIAALKEQIAGYKKDIDCFKSNRKDKGDDFHIMIGTNIYSEKKEAGVALLEGCRNIKQPNIAMNIGEYSGFKLNVTYEPFFNRYVLGIKGAITHEVQLGPDIHGNLQRIVNTLEAMEGKKADLEQKLVNVEKQLEVARQEVLKPFDKEQELVEKQQRLAQLNTLLNMDEQGMKANLEEEKRDEEKIEEMQTEDNPTKEIISCEKQEAEAQEAGETLLSPVQISNANIMDDLIKENRYDDMIPDNNGEPLVKIIWSEARELEDGICIPLSEADRLLKRLDKERTEENEKGDNYYYEKVKFELRYYMDGEYSTYGGRYDIGDGDGSLTDHIHKYQKQLLDDDFYKDYVIQNQGLQAWEEEKKSRQSFIESFIPYMKLHCNISDVYRYTMQAKERQLVTSTLTEPHIKYYEAMENYVEKARMALNHGSANLPDMPSRDDFINRGTYHDRGKESDGDGAPIMERLEENKRFLSDSQQKMEAGIEEKYER